MITKTEIDSLVAKFETEDFIKDDPVRFPNRFRDKKDIEIAGFMASLVASFSSTTEPVLLLSSIWSYT